MRKTTTNKREFLMHAHSYNPDKHDPTGMYASEKLDGTRAFWDGGVTRGLPTEDVPWAGVLEPKTLQRKSKIKPVSTGLWSRYGNPIIAPDSWLDQLPPIPLDGELFAGRGNFQLTRSIVAGDSPDPRWQQVQYCVFGSPNIAELFKTGTVKDPRHFCNLDYEACARWLRSLLSAYNPVGLHVPDRRDDYVLSPDQLESGLDYENWGFYDSKYNLVFDALAHPVPLKQEQTFIRAHVRKHTPVRVLDQTPISNRAHLDLFMNSVLDCGGEGIILRDGNQGWVCARSHNVLKYKPFHDAEARIIGFTAGRGKYDGMIGALVTDYNGKRLELSGLTDAERSIRSLPSGADVVPGKDLPQGTSTIHFRIGETVTFRYRELSDDGIPKDARYWRK